ncbi:hypothetical protein [Corallococcus aberystwythensis]|uniref:hypothetical protein n=1 Tax=Corallococcus aberystwythensis TaxID=2316722 RepID=UPI00142EC69B|nr:hypothetical protein [Corallococcus aberystwythensis]
MRFQVSQGGLDPQDPMFRQSYVDRVKAGVQLARSLGSTQVLIADGANPVIATEWNANSENCKTGTEARIPDFFAWLQEHRIGLLGHAFDVPGSMVKDLVSWQPTP